MSAEQLFSFVSWLALLGWLLLAAFPKRRWPAELVCGWVIPGLLGGVYVVLLATTWGQAPGGFSSLADVALLFDDPWLLLAGWVHYLAFDLVVGSWIVRDARERGIPHLLRLPSLALTFLFGPAGWLSYLLLRALLRQRSRATPVQPVPE